MWRTFDVIIDVLVIDVVKELRFSFWTTFGENPIAHGSKISIMFVSKSLTFFGLCGCGCEVLWIFTFHLNKLSGVLKSKIFCQKSTYLKKTTEVCQKVSKSYFQSGLLFLRIPHDFVFNQIVQEHVWKEHLLVTPFFETLTACLIFWQTVSSWIHKVQWFPLIECVDFGQNLAFKDPETLLGEK